MKSNWFVVQVMAGQEISTCEDIRKYAPLDAYSECFVPLCETLYRVKAGSFQKRIKPMFPGYVFVVTNEIEKFASSLNFEHGFRRVVKVGESYAPIEQEEADLLISMFDGELFNPILSLSTGVIENTQIIVKDGPLKGREGMIKNIDRHHRKCVIEVMMFNQPMRITMPLEIVEKLS